MTTTESNMGAIGVRAFALPHDTGPSRREQLTLRGVTLHRVVTHVGGEPVAVYSQKPYACDLVRGVAAAVIASRALGDEARKLRESVLRCARPMGHGLGAW